jgi:indole-3-glycerol phosphate synthase
VTTYLDGILEAHRARAAADSRSSAELLDRIDDLGPTRGFAEALRGGSRLHVIAEVKRRSPSKGPLAPGLDPARLAREYALGGASCLSVLTDSAHFGGSADDLRSARAAVDLPVLRKDFTVAPNDVLDARLMGADCVLLIAAALEDGELADLSALAAEVGLDALVEIHDEAELERAMEHTTGELIGVNQRDLVTFEVDRARAVRMAAAMPSATVRVAESGVRGAADATALAVAGYHAVLVGEHLVTSPDRAAALGALLVSRTAGV